MKHTTWTRTLALFLAAAMLLGMAPGTLLTGEVRAVSNADRITDPGTYNSWRDYFPTEEGSLHTQEAGAVWTDKSVFKPGELPSLWSDVQLADTGDNFLVALSALAANKQVEGFSHLPTDTMLILDVSGSMDDEHNNCASELTTAANAAIKRLLELNGNNRVGVVLYSGSSRTGSSNENTGVVLLPLDRYTPNQQGNYLSYSNSRGSETVGVATGVVSETTGRQVSGSKTVVGGTYIQNGTWKAAEELLAANPIVTDGIQKGVVRMPIMVLMTDGEPTTGTTSYTDPQTSNIGNGTSTSDLLGFVTQLTAAYSKAKVEEHYGRKAQFYTLGLEVSGSDIVQAVLNPSNRTTNTISNAWTRILSTYGGDTVTVSNQTISKNHTYINANTRYYVDQYYNASATSGTSSGQALLNAFESIVEQIVLQSRYYPTLVEEGNPDVDGYVTFRDEIGLYMEVTSIKGIRLNGVLHTGALLARNFVGDGGELGTLENPESLGSELVWAIQKRLGIETVADVRALLNNAYSHGQLSYTSDSEFSNYIGWFGDANEQFVDFWYEGMPESQYPAGATFINKSYLFLGDVDTAHGIAASDMMYTMVRVCERIKESADGTQKVGEVIVDWSIPAALIPTITYEVVLNGETYESGVKDITVEPWVNASGATVPYYPIRLMYEVALRSDLNELNIEEKTGGQTTFYTNAWNSDVRDTSVNTFSHFEPSRANERFYFTESKEVLVKSGESYVPYTGNTLSWAENTYYHSHRYFDTGKGDNGVVYSYELLTQPTVEAAQRQQDGTWLIPIGTIHRYYHDVEQTKEANTTGTNAYSLNPFIRYQQASDTSLGHYYVTSTLGNNGKLTVRPATGILLSKELADGAAHTDRLFTFEISGGNESSYTVTPLNPDGSYGTAYTVAVTGGKATVQLKSGEVVYITGMTGGTAYTVTELSDSEYVVDTVLVNGQPASNPAAVTPADQSIASVSFTNHEKGEGSLFITKEVTSSISYPAKEFEISVKLEGNYNEDLQILASNMADPSGDPITVTDYTYENGVITGLKLVHGQTLGILGLTEGTVATVTEADPGAGFALVGYTSRDYSGAEEQADNVAVIYGERFAVVTVNNRYDAPSVELDLSFEGIKNFDASQMTEDSRFTFQLQQYVRGEWVNVDGATATVQFAAGDASGAASFVIPTIHLELDEVRTYPLQIFEVTGDNTDITYDPSIYTFGVVVTDNGDGTLKAEVVSYEQSDHPNFKVTGSDGSYTVSAIFHNEYHTAGTYLDVVKEVTDLSGSGKTGEGFTIVAYEATVDAGDNWVRGNEVFRHVTDAAGETRFARSYDNSDLADGTDEAVLHYLVVEENTGAEGWSYDTTEYRVTVKLTRDPNTREISAKMSVYRVHPNGLVESVVSELNAGSHAVVRFKNTFRPEEFELIDRINAIPAAYKQMVGRDLAAGEFAFEILGDPDGDGSFTDVVAEGTNAAAAAGANAVVTFVEKNEGLTFAEVGTYYFKIREVAGTLGGVTYAPSIFDMVVEVTESNGKLEANYFFEDATGLTVTFTNTYSAAPAELTLSGTKLLTGGRTLFAGEFAFDLVEMADSTFATVKQGGYTAEAFNTGAYASGNEAVGAVTFEPITYTAPGTYYYKITERTGDLTKLGVTYSNDAAYVTVVVTDPGNGALSASASYTMRDAGGSTMSFVNTYKPQPAGTDFSVTKVLEGRALNDGEFTFGLFEAEVDGEGNWTAVGTALREVTNAASGAIDFGSLTFGAADVYTYIVKEIPGTLGGITYDDIEYRITITVTDDWKGRLQADVEIVDQNGVPYEVIIFTNRYGTDEGILLLEGTKTIIGRDMLPGETFAFTVKEGEETVSTGTVTGAKNGTPASIVFGAIEYTLADIGEHTYVITEEGTDGNGLIYSKEVYTFKVTISDNGDGTLKITPDAGNPASMDFTNTYTASGSFDLEGATKVLEGRDMFAGETFTFQMKEGQTVVSEAEISGMKSGETAQLDFSTIEYGLDDLGEHTYTVTEVNGGKPGLTYSDKVYTVVVTVTDNGDGTLSAAITGETKAADVIFNNSYSVADGELILSGSKTLIGRDMLDGETFAFVVKEGDTVKATASVSGGKDGVAAGFNFSAIAYTKADIGEHTYVITEEGTDGNGLIYSKESYTFKVTVSDNGDGTLKITPDASNPAAMSFENTYSASGSFDLEGATKVLEGRDMFAGETFTFELKEGQTVVSEAEISGMKSGETAQLDFGTIEYGLDDLGEHTYTVTEVNGGKPGLTYSDKVYTVVVTVTDNGDGTLSAEITGETKAADVIFNNSYAITDGELILSGSKTLVGRDMLEGETFTFQIREGAKLISEISVSGAEDGVAKTFSFPAIPYTKADIGEHTYTVSEVTEIKGGVSYSEVSYTVKVTVSDNGDGTLKIMPDANNPASLDFTNTYEAFGSFTLEGATKTLTGRDMFADESFIFRIVEDTEIVSEAAVTGMKAGQTAAITFPAISYTLEDLGEHTYTVSEVDGGKGGLNYSDAVFTVIVVVTDNGDGTLKAERKEGSAQTVIFSNDYAPAKTHLALSGVKTLTGRDMAEGETFTFEVKEGDTVVAKATAKGGKKGKAVTFQFTAIEYTAAGVHTYTVYEVNGGKTIDNVKYDDAVYTVTVTVVDNGDGTLTATADQDGTKLAFKNAYSKPTDPPKTGDSGDLLRYTAGMFAALVALAVLFVIRPRRRGRYER